MPVTINGSGSITGFVAQTANIANGAIGTNQLADGAASGSKLTMPAGSVVQVVNVYYDNHQSISGTGEQDHGFTATITPKASGNKIWISMSGVVGSAYTDNFARGLFKLDIAGAGYNTIGAHFFIGGRKTASRDTETWTHDYLHTTSSASVHNFKLYTRVIDGNSMNIGGWSHDANWKHRTTCTLMEVAG